MSNQKKYIIRKWQKSFRAVTAITTALSLFVTQSLAYALPINGQVVAGQASITESQQSLAVTQSSNRAILNWQSFDIDHNQRVDFIQPSSQAITLNRVTGNQNPSQILGALNANGKVMLVNPEGILFGAGAQINVGSLLATSSNIDNHRFMLGDYTFDQPGNPNAVVANAGRISIAEGGLAALVAPNVKNSGYIQAKLGKVALASGDRYTLDIDGDGLINLTASDAIQSQLVHNSGTILAEGGKVLLTTAAAKNVVNSLINMDGLVVANSIGTADGEITLYAEGNNAVPGNIASDKGQKSGYSTVLVSGTLNASGYGEEERGGIINVLGDRIGLLNGAYLDASGATCGGNVKIGGNYQGKGNTPTATHAVVQEHATIKANASKNGKGGQVIVWADDTTQFYGNIEAKGGAEGGDGGFIETSGKQKLIATGRVDASSAWGQAGLWLLDPNNITIDTSADTNVSSSGVNPVVWDTTDNSGVVTVASILSSLDIGTSVTIQTGTAGANNQDGDITVAADIGKTGGTDATLLLKAADDIIINASVDITSNSGKLNLILNADSDGVGGGTITLNTGSTIVSNDGNITMGGGADPTTTAAKAKSNGTSGVLLNTTSINAGSGNILVRGQGADTALSSPGISLTGSAIQTTGAGSITLIGTGGTNSSSNHGIYNAVSLISTDSGTLTITGNAGSGSSVSNGIYNTGVITTVTGQMDISGTGAGTVAYGIANFIGSISSTGTGAAGTVTLTGTGGSSLGNGIFSSATISTVDANLVLIGNGGSSLNGNIGIENAASISSTGTGSITLTGNGGGTTTDNYGVHFSSTGTVSAINSAINITGTAGNGNSTGNYGVYFDSANAITSTGSSTITITATGMNGAADFYNDGTAVTIGGASATGPITLNQNTATWGGLLLRTTGNVNIQNRTAATTIGVAGSAGTLDITSAFLGNIIADTLNIGRNNGSGLLRIAGVDLSATNYNLSFLNGSADIQFDGGGTALTLPSNKVLSATTSAGGDIVSGGAGGVVASGTGTVSLISDDDITITHDFDITTAGGTVTLRANDDITYSGSGDITTNNAVITLNSDRDAASGGAISLGSGTTLTSNGGNIVLGGGADPTTTAAIGTVAHINGITLDQANINAGGGNIIMRGNGGVDAAGSNYGIYQYVTTVQTSGSGTITQIGTGGTGVGGNNRGIYYYWPSTLTQGAAAISITGTGGSGGSNNEGIYLNTGTAINATGTGTLTLTGTGGTGSGENHGVMLYGATTSVVNGALNYMGTAGNGAPSFGINLDGATIVSTGSGTIGLTSTDTLRNSVDATTVGGASATGDITLTANTLSLSLFTVQTTGIVTLKPYTDSRTIGVGGAAGDFSVSSTLLNAISAGTVNIGSTAGTGALHIAGTDLSATNYHLALLSGSGDLSFDGGVTALLLASNKNFSATTATGADILSGGNGSIATTGTGTVTVVSDDDITFANDLDITTATGAVTLRADDDIVYSGGGDITTSNAAITLNSDRDAASGGAISLGSGTTLTSNGGNITLGGGADPSTTAAIGTAANIYGISLDNAQLVAGGGNVSLRGTGFSVVTDDNYGIQLINGSDITTTGSGTIVLTGVGGGGGASRHNYGLYLNGSGTTISAVNGNITLTGTGGTPAGNSNSGVNTDQVTVETTGSGDISVVGNGGTVGIGIEIIESLFRSTGSGDVTFTAIGSGSNRSIDIDGNGSIVASTTTGNITIGGSGAGRGVYISDASMQATGNGNIVLTGSGTSSGIELYGPAGTMFSSAGGGISFVGTGLGAFSIGIAAYDTQIVTTGSGNVSFTGNGGIEGLELTNDGVTPFITTADGNITLSGTASSNNGVGIYMSGLPIEATGTGTISLSGTVSGSGGSGIEMEDDNAFITNTGTITLTADTLSGTGINTGDGDHFGDGTENGDITFVANSINFDPSSTIQTLQDVIFRPFSANGTVGVAGAAGNLAISNAMLANVSADNVIIGRSDGSGLMRVAGTNLSTTNYNLSLLNGSGNIQFDGGAALTLASNKSFSTAATSGSFTTSATGSIVTSGTGDITIDDPVSLGGNLLLSTADTLTMGSTVNGGFNFTASAGTMSFASAFGGSTPLAAVALTSVNSLTLPSITATTIFARTTGAGSDITIPVGRTLTASGPNTAITLVSADDFTNASASPFNLTGGGRWLIYSETPGDNSLNSLTADFSRYSCVYAGSCPSFPLTGNGFLYSYSPTLTATPSALAAITYGDAVPGLIGYAYALSGYLGSDGSSDSITGSLTGATTYTQGSNVGSYNINYSSGTLASTLGYSFSYANNATAITVNKRAITGTMQAQNITYGTTTPTQNKANTSHVVWGNLYGSDTGTALDSVTFSYGGAGAGSVNNAGAYTLGISAFTDNNYSLALPGGVTNATLTINPASLTVTANNLSKTEGDTDPSLTYGYSGLTNGDVSASFTGALSRIAGESAGNYSILQDTLAAIGNYVIGAYNPGTLTINASSSSGSTSPPDSSPAVSTMDVNRLLHHYSSYYDDESSVNTLSVFPVFADLLSILLVDPANDNDDMAVFFCRKGDKRPKCKRQ